MMSQRNRKEECLINYSGSDGCLYTLTQQYLSYLNGHQGSLQPSCKPGHPNQPHATKAVVYSTALSDFRNVSFTRQKIYNE